MTADERLLCIVGPTASGKSALALRLASSLGGEILSADSMQIYRGFDVGTGKPNAEERALVPHHLVDVADPLEAWDAARWADEAVRLIAEIRSRGRVPIVCGGTFLWVRALIYGLAEAPRGDDELRARHRAWAEQEGRAALHARLTEVDPPTAARLAPNDFVRVSRALEVFELTGKPMSEVQAAHGFRAPRFAARLLGVARERAEQDELIASRVRGMLAAGWLAEVEALRAAGFGEARAMASVGYRQITEAMAAGTVTDEAALAEAIVRATRVFARRQRTWLRDQPVEWLPADATKLP
ncbi:MAG TPA: tRNA (adenosine(37)-N6)-dimethylallyltransferase MiaA [Polyangiaceae bacterium]|nr:tRNA (adenosine(37)-N6)-dimethylallyltransferase MiaA [Polyangiaceae bacterium]